MGRLLALVLGLGVLGAIAYKVMYRQSAVTAGEEGPSAPKQQLENVRGAANRIEAEGQKNADDLAKKAFGNE